MVEIKFITILRLAYSMSFQDGKKSMESAINVEEGITFAWTKLNVSTKAVPESKVAGLVLRQEKTAKRILREVTGIARPGEVLTIITVQNQFCVHLYPRSWPSWGRAERASQPSSTPSSSGTPRAWTFPAPGSLMARLSLRPT